MRGLGIPHEQASASCVAASALDTIALPTKRTAARFIYLAGTLARASQPTRPRSKQCFFMQAFVRSRPVSFMPESASLHSTIDGATDEAPQASMIVWHDAVTPFAPASAPGPDSSGHEFMSAR